MTTRWEIRVDEANPEEEIPLTENGRIVLERRYLRKGPDGRPVETIPEMFRRVARAIAEAEKELGGDPALWEERFYRMLTSLRFLPNSPTFTGAGTPLGQLAACFTPEMRVMTDRGLKRIADLRPGDRVLTHRGRYQPVLQTSRRFYRGRLKVIKVRRIGQPIRATPEHPFLTPRGWVMAADLRPGDWVAVGFPKGILPVESFDLAGEIPVEDLEFQAVSIASPAHRPAADPNWGRHARWVPSLNADDGEHIYYEIEEIQTQDYEGAVYNCEVEEDHSYVVEGVVVHNCFVLPLEDDMGKIPGGIFQTLRDAALIQQTGGGNGFSFSRLRPKNAIVFSSMGRATGPVGFLRVYDRAFGEIAQGGSRRGANMAVLRVDHPDIEEFITCKTDENAITNFNISVGITDAFMRAVENDEEWELRFPDVLHPAYRDFRGTLEDAERAGIPIKVYKRVRARDLFRKIATQAHHNGEPGVLFLDTANRSNPVPHLYTLEATNPCGEQWLGPFENCCLGSVNLARHVKYVNGRAEVDWEKLQETVEWATRFLDNVVQVNRYVPAVPQLKEAAYRTRRIGLGFMGLADLMYHLRIRYGSEEGQEFAAQIAEFIRYHAMRTSIELAKERGPFPAIRGSIYDPENLKWEPPKPLKPYTRDWGRPPLDWNAIVEGIRRYGIRNAAQTTVAPTGTLSTVAGCEGYGCEPVFALAYIRYVHEAEGRLELRYVSPLFMRALKEAGLDEEARARIIEEVLRKGTCQHIQELPDWIRHTFVVAQDLTPEEHVWMQASIQAFIDNSISKCVTGDTLVLTENGLVPIASLSPMRLPDQFEPIQLRVVSPDGVEPANLFYYGGKRETRRVYLRYGFEIEGTPNHPIQVLGDDGRIRFVPLEALKPGDLVVLYMNQQRFGPPGQPLPPYVGSWRTSSRRIRFPERMSEDLAYLLGCITSEGSITANGVAICHHDRMLLQRLEGIFYELFGLRGHIVPDRRRKQLYNLQVNSRPLRDWLINALGMRPGARNKVIPESILRASREEIIAFLRGLFLDAFVTKDGRMFGITLASRTLIRQLQVLLLNMGIFSRVTRSGAHAWALTVSGEALERLAAIAQFDEPWKTQRIEARHNGRDRRLFNYGLLLPESVTQALRAMQRASTRSLLSLYGKPGPEYQRARVNLLMGHRMERRMAHRVYRHFDDVEHPYACAFFASDRPDMLYIPVERVESGFAEVFDLHVPGSHAFIANGIGNHNTINFPETATVEDVEKAYMLAWKLGCKGLTVYVAGSRQKEVLETLETKEKKEKKREEGLMVPTQPTLPQPVGPTVRPRPQKLAGVTYRIATPVGTAFITLNENGEGQPFEVFLNVGKAGSDIAAVAEAIGRLISLLLRLPSPVPPAERLRQVVDQLQGIGGGRALGFGPERVRSLPDGIARVLAEYLTERGMEAIPVPSPAVQPALPLSEVPPAAPEETGRLGPVGDLCPQCGEATLLEQEGCRTCYNCGYSEC